MIEEKHGTLNQLHDELAELVKEDLDENVKGLSDTVVVNINNLFSAKETLSLISKIEAFNNNEIFTYENLSEIDEYLSNVYQSLQSIKQDVDLDLFFKDGYTLDIGKVKEKFNKKGLRAKYPDFDFDRLEELYKKPPKFLTPYYNERKKIEIDEFVFRKYMIGLIQMVLDHMDLVVAITGGEGTGKSTHVSQLMWMVHWILKELKIVDYPFSIKDLFFNTLESLRLKEDDLFEKPFSILALDEGNELHRQNWKDEEVQTFFQRLRRERYNQRIKFICIPVLGELMSSIVLSRVNFVTEMVNTNDVTSGSLNKGRAHFYIIPRGDNIYSPKQNREIPKGEIKTCFYDFLKDKNWLKGIPKEVLVTAYKCNGVWGFPEALYEKELKKTNRTFQVTGGLKMTDTEAFYFYKSAISLKAVGLDSKDVKYATVNKFLNRLKRYFEDNIDNYNKQSLILERKQAERLVKNQSV
jgi:hypothetical protein